MSRKKLKEQCYVFSTNVFKNKRGVKRWLRMREIKTPKYAKVKKFDKQFRIKVRDCCRFKKETLQKKKIRKGVHVVRGYLKSKK
jgi:hypothetical protein